MDLFLDEEDENSEAEAIAVEVAKAIFAEVCLRHGVLPSECRVRSVVSGSSSKAAEVSTICHQLRLAGMSSDMRDGELWFQVVVGDDSALEESERIDWGALAVATHDCAMDIAWTQIHPPVAGWTILRRRLVAADVRGCAPWGAANEAEHDRVEACCIRPSDDVGAARTLREKGVVILPALVRDAAALERVAREAEANFERCRSSLESLHGVDLRQPHLSMHEPHSYRELAMREDCRCDVRLALPSCDALDEALRQAERIARLASVEPTHSPLAAGNYGRYNFDDKGPHAPSLPLVVGPLATIVSLPGAAEQALHADAPHLFDHVQLPGHYFNIFFSPKRVPADAGQTAFVLGSHQLRRCAYLTSQADDDRCNRIKPELIRPRLRPGDAVLFDARILHFGLPNRSQVVRPLVYCNIHAAWFRDAKNWDDHSSVFENPRHAHRQITT